MISPLIIPQYVEWAIGIVRNDIYALSAKFESGMVGTNSDEIKQQDDLIRMIKIFVTKDWSECKTYCQGKCDKKLHDEKIVPYSFLNKRLSSMASFKNDKRKATAALKIAIQILIDSDKIREINKNEASIKYGTVQRCFIISDATVFD